MPEFGIASKIIPPKIDPLATIGQLQGVQRGMLENKLLGQNLQQTLAQRAAAQGSIDPVTGQYSPDRNIAALASGGATQESIQQAQAAKLQQLQTQIAGLGLSKAQMELSAQELGNGAMVGQGILANGTKDPSALTKEGVATSISDNLIKTGLIKSEDGLKHAQDFISQLTDDPAKNAQLVQAWVNQSTDITKAMGAINNTDLPGAVAQGRNNPATGEYTPTNTFQKGLSPGQLAQTVTVIDPVTKEQKTTTLGALLGQPVGQEGGRAPRNGRYPGKGGGNALEAPGGVTTGLAPGDQVSMDESAKQYQADTRASKGVAQRIQGLQIAQKELLTAPTGKGSEIWQDARAKLMAAGIPIPASEKAKTISYAKAAKYMQDYANNRGVVMGLGTDAGRDMIKSANPGVDTPNPAAREMVPVIIGLERMDAATTAAARAAHVPAGKYTEWAADLNTRLDPWGFAADQPNAATYRAHLTSPAQRAKYQAAVEAAIAAGQFTLKDIKR